MASNSDHVQQIFIKFYSVHAVMLFSNNLIVRSISKHSNRMPVTFRKWV